jgi:hypothetical protein
MIGDALRLEVERYASRARRTNPLYVRAREGSLRPRHVAAYLAGIHYLLLHTSVHLSLAIARATERGEMELARHYAHKLDEEVGHEVWAERDMERLARTSVEATCPGVHQSVKDMVAYVEDVIHDDPSLYLAYILFMEYVTVILGPEWIELLDSRCGIPRSSMSVVDKHAALDRDHVDEGLIIIDALVGDPKKLPKMREALLGAAKRFDQFCRGTLEDSDGSERFDVDHDIVRVPAA